MCHSAFCVRETKRLKTVLYVCMRISLQGFMDSCVAGELCFVTKYLFLFNIVSTLYSLCLCISILSYSAPPRTLPLRGRCRGHVDVVVDVDVDVSNCCSKSCKSSSVNVDLALN